MPLARLVSLLSEAWLVPLGYDPGSVDGSTVHGTYSSGIMLAACHFVYSLQQPWVVCTLVPSTNEETRALLQRHRCPWAHGLAQTPICRLPHHHALLSRSLDSKLPVKVGFIRLWWAPQPTPVAPDILRAVMYLWLRPGAGLHVASLSKGLA